MAKEEREEQEALDDAEILTQEAQEAKSRQCKSAPVATPARAAAIPEVSCFFLKLERRK